MLFQDLVDEGDIPSNQPVKSKGKGERIMWSIAEDKALCSAFLEAGGDPVIGTDQKRVDFWAKIIEMYDEGQRENPSDLNTRNYDQCKCRWRRIHEQVNKWVGVYVEAQRKKKSGWNEDNVIGEAREIWANSNNGHKFIMEHCWEILKHCPKWQNGMSVEDQESTHSSKRSNSDSPTVELRPPGVKKSKRNGKAGGSSQIDLENITTCINNLNLNRELDAKRLQLEADMLEFYKEKEEKKEATMNRKFRFKMYNTLMGKSTLSIEETELYARLYQEFKNI